MTTHIPGADAIKWLQTRTQTIFDGKTGDGVTSVTYSTLFARSPQFEPVGLSIMKPIRWGYALRP